MSLDEAIKYYSHLADENRRKADIERNDYMDLKDLTAECEQLANWLNELKVLREKIQKLLEKQEQDGWIPVTERLPDKSEDYLVTNYIEKWGDKITETCEAYYVYNDPIYKTSYWCGSENHKLGKISAWRQLPEPYTEEENE